MDLILGLLLIVILIPINYIMLKLSKCVYDAFGKLLLSMLFNILIIAIYTYGLYADVSSLLKFALGIGLAVILNMFMKIFIVSQELSKNKVAS